MNDNLVAVVCVLYLVFAVRFSGRNVHVFQTATTNHRRLDNPTEQAFCQGGRDPGDNRDERETRVRRQPPPPARPPVAADWLCRQPLPTSLHRMRILLWSSFNPSSHRPFFLLTAVVRSRSLVPSDSDLISTQGGVARRAVVSARGRLAWRPAVRRRCRRRGEKPVTRRVHAAVIFQACMYDFLDVTCSRWTMEGGRPSAATEPAGPAFLAALMISL